MVRTNLRLTAFLLGRYKLETKWWYEPICG